MSKGMEQTEKIMAFKIIQVQIFSEYEIEKLESEINKCLINKKIIKDNLIDIKFCRTSDYKTAMIIYEIDYEEKK